MDARFCQSFLFAHLFGNPAYLVGFTHNRINSEKFQLCVTFWGTACKVIFRSGVVAQWHLFLLV